MRIKLAIEFDLHIKGMGLVMELDLQIMTMELYRIGSTNHADRTADGIRPKHNWDGTDRIRSTIIRIELVVKLDLKINGMDLIKLDQQIMWIELAMELDLYIIEMEQI